MAKKPKVNNNQRIPQQKPKKIRTAHKDEEPIKKVRFATPRISTARTPAELERAKQYNRERQRIKSAVKRAQSRGYIFDDLSFLPEKRLAPTAAQIKKAKSFKGGDIYRKAKYYNPLTDEYMPGTHRRKQERQESARKAAETRRNRARVLETEAGRAPSEVSAVLDSVFSLISDWKPLPQWSDGFAQIKEADKGSLENLINGLCERIGREAVAQNAEAHAAEIIELAWRICYGYSGDNKNEGIQADLVTIYILLSGRSISVAESKRVQEMIDQRNWWHEGEEE